jgi:hypothetical protein
MLSIVLPTAMQADADVHDTPPSAAPPCGRLGVAWMVHLVPSQRSARVVASPELFTDIPVVVHADGDVQDTDPMKTACAPAGAGIGRILQDLPFQRSASGIGLGVLKPEPPAAMQNDCVGHDTPPKLTPGAPVGLGVGWICHRVPFHRSAKVLALETPTAVQDEAVVHETPTRPPGGRAGVGRMLQSVPFHCSARNPPTSFGLEVPPTAMQDLADVQSTPKRPLAAAPARLGVDWIAHVVPFQCSARVTGVLRLLREPPTAVQPEAEMHDTAFRPVR